VVSCTVVISKGVNRSRKFTTAGCDKTSSSPFSNTCSSRSRKLTPFQGSKVKIWTLLGRARGNPEYCNKTGLCLRVVGWAWAEFGNGWGLARLTNEDCRGQWAGTRHDQDRKQCWSCKPSTVAKRLARHFAFGRSRVLTPVRPDLVWVFFRGFPTPSHRGMFNITDKANAGSVSTSKYLPPSFRTHPHHTHPESSRQCG
jgi:hypothetical protein